MKNLNLSGINFWLEADQEKIDFETIDVTKKENKKLINEDSQYIMEQAIILLPYCVLQQIWLDKYFENKISASLTIKLYKNPIS